MDPTFSSVFVNRIDAKGRVSVPAPYRALLAAQRFNGIAAIPSDRFAMIEASGVDRTDWMREQLETLTEFTDEYFAVQALFSEFAMIPFDGEGRIILPQPLLQHANLTDTVLFAGGGNVFQLWEPGAYEAFKQAMREHRKATGTGFAPRRPSPQAAPR